MNTCTREERLTAWLLGDLPSDEAEALRLHLAECAACSSRVAELEPVIAALREGLTAPPPKPLHLFPAQRRRVLATPYQNRFSRWWGADSASILKIAAAVAILAALAASLFPAVSSSRDQARSTALKARERAAWVAQISETMERESDEAAFSDLSVQTGAEVPQSHLIVGHQPNGATFTPEIVLEPPPPLADAQPLSPQPAEFDSVMQVKSPVILHNLFGTTRAAGTSWLN